MQTFCYSGRVYQISSAYLARYVTVERFQFDSPLHGTGNHHLINVTTCDIAHVPTNYSIDQLHPKCVVCKND